MKICFKKFKDLLVCLTIRRWVQFIFCAIVINLGAHFYLFVSKLEIGIIPGFERPPGVEAFLPISALVSLKQFIFTGTINRIHPSALVIFLMVCLTALMLKKGFCSWICPVGLLSDGIAKLHITIFKKKVSLPILPDLLLRTIKYGLAGFFIWSIFYKMPIGSIEQFIISPYNQFADVKMLFFFTHISQTAFIVMLSLIFLSFIIPYFWCRYLCPYGAILSVLSFLSIGKIKRDPSHCTHCGRCEKKCPSQIQIQSKEQIHSSECTACMTCVKNCPEDKAIGFYMFPVKKTVKQAVFALILFLLFAGGITTAKVSSNWQNEIPKTAYLQYVIQQNIPWDTQGRIDPEKMEKMKKIMKNIQAQKVQMFELSSPEAK